MGRATQAVKRALRPVLSPAAERYRSARAQLDEIDRRGQVINSEVSVLLERLVELEGQIRVDATVLGEFSSASRRIVSKLEDRLDELGDVVGPPGDTAVDASARYVETPAVVAALSGIEPPRAVVVAGRDTGAVAVALTALGYSVTRVETGIDHSSSPLEPVAAAIVLLDADEDAAGNTRILDRAHDWVEPGGRLVLALAYGPGVEPGARAFAEQRAKLLTNWQVTRDLVYACSRDRGWALVLGGRSDVDWASVQSTLVLVAATSP